MQTAAANQAETASRAESRLSAVRRGTCSELEEADNHAWPSDHPTLRSATGGTPMPLAASRTNSRKSMVRSAVEQVFTKQKARMSLVIRTIRVQRAILAITLINIAYNMRRLVWLTKARGVA